MGCVHASLMPDNSGLKQLQLETDYWTSSGFTSIS